VRRHADISPAAEKELMKQSGNISSAQRVVSHASPKGKYRINEGNAALLSGR